MTTSFHTFLLETSGGPSTVLRAFHGPSCLILTTALVPALSLGRRYSHCTHCTGGEAKTLKAFLNLYSYRDGRGPRVQSLTPESTFLNILYINHRPRNTAKLPSSRSPGNDNVSTTVLVFAATSYGRDPPPLTSAPAPPHCQQLRHHF